MTSPAECLATGGPFSVPQGSGFAARACLLWVGARDGPGVPAELRCHFEVSESGASMRFLFVD